MSDDIVTRLRRVMEIKMYNELTDELEVVATFTKSDDSLEAADEIERLRAERLQWFVVARQLRDALIGAEEKDAAFDEYLRTRGRLEDPREQAEG